MQGLMLLIVGPFIDQALTTQWVVKYDMTTAAGLVLGASCAIAVLVNISQFMCLGRFSAVTFQVGGNFVGLLSSDLSTSVGALSPFSMPASHLELTTS